MVICTFLPRRPESISIIIQCSCTRTITPITRTRKISTGNDSCDRLFLPELILARIEFCLRSRSISREIFECTSWSLVIFCYRINRCLETICIAGKECDWSITTWESDSTSSDWTKCSWRSRHGTSELLNSTIHFQSMITCRAKPIRTSCIVSTTIITSYIIGDRVIFCTNFIC